MELAGNSQSIPRAESGHTRDVMSELPQVLVELILRPLPIKEAVRTSILARAWKSKWTTLPELVFDERSIGLGDDMLGNNGLMTIIGNVLLQHEGYIRKLTISFPNSERADSSDVWISHLEIKRVQELTLEFLEGSPYNVPSRLFGCQYLHCLKLKRCTIKLPYSFVGCKCLKTLYLEEVWFDGDDFGRLTSGCPVLENLTLVNIHKCFLSICIPTLKHVYIEGKFAWISFQKGSCISHLHICMNERNKNMFRWIPYNILGVLHGLSGIEKFELRDNFTKFLSFRREPTRFPANFHHLREIYMTLNFKDFTELSTVLCLCRSSPSLRYLEITALLIKARLRPASHFWREQNQTCGFLNHLQTLKIIGFSAYCAEMGFIKHIVRKSPALEKIILVPTKETFSEVAAMFEWMKRPKASVEAASGTVELVF